MYQFYYMNEKMCSFFFLVSAAVNIQPSSNPAAAGDNVTLSVTPEVTMGDGNWVFGSSPILTWLGSDVAVFGSYQGRASVNVATGALTLTSVTLADSGTYKVQSDDPPLTASTFITVLGKTC